MKSQLFEIAHATTYEYRSAVTVAHHLLRLSPRPMPRQSVLFHDIQIDPAPAVFSQRKDYFGNQVTFVTLEGAHRKLVVTGRSRVAVAPAFIPDAAETPSWESVRQASRSDRSGAALEATEFTFGSPLVPVDGLYGEYADGSFTPHRPIMEAVLDLLARIHADFKFDATATTVSTPLSEMMRNRRGVCQDFAHLLIACLRSLGLPARYVSGYLETLPAPGQPKLSGVDASHAWVSFFCPGLGWLDVDPTNNLLPSLQHITLGWGRDYADVCPIRGVLVGGSDHGLRVCVDVAALGPVEASSRQQADALETSPCGVNL